MTKLDPLRAQLPASPQVPAFTYAPPAVGQFGGKAPTPTATGAFSWQTPTALSDVGQFRLGEGTKNLQRGAAARGTLLTGGLQGRLMGLGQQMASQEADQDFNRSLLSYTTNRDTNAQNFGQQLGAFNADLGAFGANTNASLGAGRLGLDAATSVYDRAYQAGRDQRGDQIQAADQEAALAYAQEQDAARAALQPRFEQPVQPAPRMSGLGSPWTPQASPWAARRWGGG